MTKRWIRDSPTVLWPQATLDIDRDMRRDIRDRWRGSLRPREPPVRQYFRMVKQRKQWIFIDFHWFSLISIDFWWFPLIFIDFWWYLQNIEVEHGAPRASRGALATLDAPHMSQHARSALWMSQSVRGNAYRSISHEILWFCRFVKKGNKKPMFCIY